MAAGFLVKGTRRLLQKNSTGLRFASNDDCPNSLAQRIAGNRDRVGFGWNGEPNYHDMPDFPMPSIRWKESTPENQAILEKQKLDWRELPIDVKKDIYRVNFRQTYAEFLAPTGWWKSVVGIGFIFISLGMWWSYLIMATSYDPLPISFSCEYQAAQLRRMLDLETGAVTGISSYWDYEQDDWKKK